MLWGKMYNSCCVLETVWRIEFEYKTMVIWWVRNPLHISDKKDKLKLKYSRKRKKKNLKKDLCCILEEHVSDCVDEVCNKKLNSVMTFGCKLLLSLTSGFSYASHLGTMRKKPRCCTFSMCRRFKSPNHLSSYGNPHSGPPLTTMKAWTQTAVFVFSCHFGPAWDSTAHPGALNYVSHNSFPTFLVYACHHLSPHSNQVLGGGSFCFDKMAWVQQCWKEFHGVEHADFYCRFLGIVSFFHSQKKKRKNQRG